MKRKILAFIIIAVGIGGSVLIIGRNVKPQENYDQARLLPNLESGDPRLGYGTTERELRPIYQPPAGSQTQSKTTNLTRALTKTFTQEIQKRNPNQISSDTLTLPSQLIFERLFTEQLDQEFEISQFSLADIKISEDRSPAKKTLYLSEFQKITEKNFGAFNKDIITTINNFIKKGNPSLLQEYVSIASRQVDDFYQLETPYDWRLLHLQILNSWLKKKTIFGAILNLQEDPIKAVIAIEQLGNLIEEIQVLHNTLEQEAEKLST
jgi:hypothetical protein